MKTFPVSPASTVLTFLFTDLEGSTRLWQEYPKVMETVLARHDGILTEAIEGCSGQIIKTTGDGFHAVFASVSDCLCACIRAQQDLLNEPWKLPVPLRVRMGMHSGEAQLRAGDYYGTSVNRAARLMSAANGGQVLLSETAASLAADNLPEGATLKDLGEHRLKDLQRSEHIYQLVHQNIPSNFSPISSLNQTPHNLPIQPTVFVGRQKELEEVTNMLRSEMVRMVTLIGPGGTGKTRLGLQSAVEVNDDFPDGIYFVELAPIRNPNSVLAEITRTIGIIESSNGSVLEDLKNQLGDKKLLLVLDNFEQVTSAAVYLADLLRYCPGIKLLVTSREALRVQGEHLYLVPSLSLPKADTNLNDIVRYEAVQLFLDRARAAKPDFVLTEENAEIIARLCLRLDGLPLAIELAAARIRLFSPQNLYDRLNNRMLLLRGGARDLPERHKTLRDTIDWSYELLSEDEKSVFEVVSVFAGSAFNAVEEVIDAIENFGKKDQDIEEILISLIDKSLVRLLDDDAGRPRLQMLEMIREYALETLKDKPDLYTAACHAHAAYFSDFVHRHWESMTGEKRGTALEEMTSEVENLRIGWRYWVEVGNLAELQRMVNGLWMLYDSRGWYQSAVELTTDLLQLLSTSPSSPDQVSQEIMLQTSMARALLAIKGYTSEVEDAYTRALELSEGQGEVLQLFPVLRGLASYYTYRAEFEKSIQIGKRILKLANRQDNDSLRVHGYLILGANTGFLHSFSSGLEILDKGIAIFEREQQNMRPFQLGSNPGIVCYTTSAFFLWYQGFLDRAAKRANRAIDLAYKLNHPFTIAYALFHTANLYLWRGEFMPAKERAEAMLAIAKEQGFQIWETLATIFIGSAEMQNGLLEEGHRKIENGFAAYQNLKSPPVFYAGLVGMRSGAFAQVGQPDKALYLIDELLKESDARRLRRDMLPLLLMKGDLLTALSPDKLTESANIYQMILANSLEAGDKVTALQAATRLSNLEIKSGIASGSTKTLAKIYNSFTEGFDTIILQTARKILDN